MRPGVRFAALVVTGLLASPAVAAPAKPAAVNRCVTDPRGDAGLDLGSTTVALPFDSTDLLRVCLRVSRTSIDLVIRVASLQDDTFANLRQSQTWWLHQFRPIDPRRPGAGSVWFWVDVHWSDGHYTYSVSVSEQRDDRYLNLRPKATGSVDRGAGEIRVSVPRRGDLVGLAPHPQLGYTAGAYACVPECVASDDASHEGD